MSLYYSPSINLDEIFDKTNHFVAICKKDTSIVGINSVFAKLYGFQPKDLIGIKAFELYPEFKTSVFYECCIETIETGLSSSRIGYSIPLNGWYAARTFKYDEEHFVLIANEISNHENFAGFIPLHDTLTSLFNRHKLEEDLILKTKIKSPTGLIFIDILKLKKINEIFGLNHCDMLIMSIAGKLKLKLHKEGIVTLYKVAPDKFAILAKLSRDECIELIKEIGSIFSEPFRMNTEEALKVNIAIGFNYINLFTKNAFLFLQETEHVLDLAKNKKTLFIEHTQDTCLINKKDLITEINNAFKNNEFILHYQPQIDCINNQICGVESLIRWNHPTRGLLSPYFFLSLIEEFELIEELDNYVITNALKDAKWFKEQGIEIPIAINLSSASLSKPGIVDFFDQESQKHGANNKLLTIEITETSLMEDISLSQKILSEFSLRDLKIAVDDFGSGYSSFGYLVRYPTDYLKIDKEFITNIHNNINLKRIVMNLIKMAHSLNMLVIAEGAELIEEANTLKKIGCDIIQGYIYGKPVLKKLL